MLEGEDIICIASNPWDDIWRRRQQLMSRFARGNRVLYVEPPLSFLSALFSPKNWTSFINGDFFIRGNENEPYILRQYALLPLERSFLRIGIGWVKKINDWFSLRVLKRTLKKLNFDQPVLWVYYTRGSESYIGNCGEKLVICDVYDRYSAYPYFADHPWWKEFTDRLDTALITRADIVFACSAPLFEHCKRFNARVHLVPNGTEIVSTDDLREIPEDTVDIKHPVLGYVGAIQDKLDLELLDRMAEAHPEWSLLMVGPLGVYSTEDTLRISSLMEKDNVFFVGPKHRSNLPGYYAVMDITLMPYKLTEHTEHISPLKMFEYMAFRKPTVSTDIPAVREYSDVIAVAENAEQFSENISRLLGGDNENLLQQGVEISSRNSWEQRVVEISKIIEARLPAK